MKKLFQVLSLLWLIASPALADIYYVSNTGSDSDPGTISEPFLTIQHGVDTASAGDTINVRAGTYTNPAPIFTTVRSGTSGNLITIQAYNGETVTTSRIKIDEHDYIKIDGFTVNCGTGGAGNPGIHMYSTENSIVSNNILKGQGYQGSHGITNTGGWSIDNLITGNTFIGYNTTATSFFMCIWFNGTGNEFSYNLFTGLDSSERIFELYGDGAWVHHNEVADCMLQSASGPHPDIFQTFSNVQSTNMLVEQNNFHDFRGQIGNFETLDDQDHGHSWLFRNNIFANIAAPMNISLPNTRFYNNTFYNVLWYGHADVLNCNGIGNTGGVVKNNAFIGCALDHDNRGYVNCGERYTNFVANSDGSAKTGSHVTDAINNGDINGGTLGLVDPYSNCDDNNCDFSITDQSTMYNSGGDHSAYLDDDYIGTSRPQAVDWDIGAYEYISGEAPAPEPAYEIDLSGGSNKIITGSGSNIMILNE